MQQHCSWRNEHASNQDMVHNALLTGLASSSCELLHFRDRSRAIMRICMHERVPKSAAAQGDLDAEDAGAAALEGPGRERPWRHGPTTHTPRSGSARNTRIYPRDLGSENACACACSDHEIIPVRIMKMRMHACARMYVAVASYSNVELALVHPTTPPAPQPLASRRSRFPLRSVCGSPCRSQPPLAPERCSELRRRRVQPQRQCLPPP